MHLLIKFKEEIIRLFSSLFLNIYPENTGYLSRKILDLLIINPGGIIIVRRDNFDHEISCIIFVQDFQDFV